MNRYFDFENEIENIETIINKLDINKKDYQPSKQKLLDQKKKLLKKIYSNLSPWEKVQVARHANRPHSKDYINNLVTQKQKETQAMKIKIDQKCLVKVGKNEVEVTVKAQTAKGWLVETAKGRTALGVAAQS